MWRPKWPGDLHHEATRFRRTTGKTARLNSTATVDQMWPLAAICFSPIDPRRGTRTKDLRYNIILSLQWFYNQNRYEQQRRELLRKTTAGGRTVSPVVKPRCFGLSTGATYAPCLFLPLTDVLTSSGMLNSCPSIASVTSLSGWL